MLDLALALGVSKRNRLSDAIILALFSNNEQGAYYDPYDLTDEKLAWVANFGSELITNGDFSNGFTGWSAGSDWSTVDGKAYLAPSTSVLSSSLQTPSVTSNSNPVARITVDSLTGGGLRVEARISFSWQATQWSIDNAGVFEIALPANTDRVRISRRIGEPTAVISNLSIRPMPTPAQFMAQFPNHTLFQDSHGAIPVTGHMQPVGVVLDKRFGGVRGENLRDGFVVHNSGVASNPFGFYDIDTGNFGINRVDVNDRRDLRIFNLNPSVMYEITIENTSNNAIQVRNDSASNTLVIIAAFTTVRLVSTTGNSDVFSILSTGNDSEATGIIHSIRPILGNHVHQPVSAARPLWQNNGGLKSFWFDGIDDHLLTVNTVNMLNTSQLQILTGFRKENSAVGILIHSDSGTDETFTANQIEVFLRTFTSAERYTTRLRNSLNDNVFEANASGYPINANNVMTNSIDSMAAISTVRINNDTEHSESGEGSSASLWDQQIFIGCRKGSVWYFGGHIYSLIIRSTLTEETQAEPIRQLLATRSGVTL